MSRLPLIHYKLLLCFALIFALTASAFAHSGPRTVQSPELAAYVAAGGSLWDICGTLGEEEGAQRQNCEACRLIGAALMPRTGPGLPLVLTDLTRKLTFVAKTLHRMRPRDPARLTRAPPQV